MACRYLKSVLSTERSRVRAICRPALVGALSFGLAAGVEAQVLGSGAAPDVQPVRVAAALVVCLMIGLGVIYGLRRWMGRRGLNSDTTAIRLVESLRLDARRTLFVVDFEGQRILLAADGSGINRVASAVPSGKETLPPQAGGEH